MSTAFLDALPSWLVRGKGAGEPSTSGSSGGQSEALSTAQRQLGTFSTWAYDALERGARYAG